MWDATGIAVFFFVMTVQIICGVGILVLGTPFFILNGLSLHEIMAVLLPSSALVSIMQIHSTKTVAIDFNITKLFLMVISVILGMAAFTYFELEKWITTLVGSLIVLSAPASFFSNRIRLGNISYPFHIFNGFIHGATNLGGAFLSVYSRLTFQKPDEIVRSNAVTYLLYAFVQISFLIYLYGVEKIIPGLLMLPITGVFLVLSISLKFRMRSLKIFPWLYSALLLVTGVILIIK